MKFGYGTRLSAVKCQSRERRALYGWQSDACERWPVSAIMRRSSEGSLPHPNVSGTSESGILISRK